ncbi:MAG: alpha/beta hydrolase, partial [Sphingomonas bacterium]|nr:alpha/beta hydrolase [Sphingomonas bacterium]
GAVSQAFVGSEPVRTYLYQTLQELGSARPGYGEIFALIDADPMPMALLAELGAPILIGRGEHDHVADPQAYEEIAARLPNASTIVLAGAGHSPYFEVPEQWNAAMLDHVRAAAA